jgi:hypothetical protein
MTDCVNCRHSNPDNATYCGNCGTKLRVLFPPFNALHSQPSGLAQHNLKAFASLILGVVGLIACLLPIMGGLITITGLMLGAIGLKSEKPGIAIAGMVLSILGLIAAAINALEGLIIGLEWF